MVALANPTNSTPATSRSSSATPGRKPYRSDLTDEQWAILEPMIPPAKKGGRSRVVNMREVLNTIFYLTRTGCQWDYLPHDLLPKSTVYDYFRLWTHDGTWQKMVDALREANRVAANREPTPSAASIDTQTVKTTEIGGESGYDAGKKIKGRKRHLVVDSMGLLMVVAVLAASLDDGTHASVVLGKLQPELYPRLEVVWGDGKYNNRALDAWMASRKCWFRVTPVKRPIGAKGFVPQHLRWMVERANAWVGRYRRNSKDYEYNTECSESFVKLSAIHIMLNRLTKDNSKKQNPFNYPKKEKAA